MTQAKPFRLADYLGHILEAIDRAIALRSFCPKK